VPSGGFAAECRAEVSNVEWMKAHSTLKASASGAAGAGRSPAVAPQNGRSTALSSKCEQCHVYS